MLPCVVVWSEHAVSRAIEREAGNPPKDRIMRQIERVDIGQEFHVKEFLYIWVCKRIGIATAMIVTVIHNDKENKIPKQRRLEIKRERRLQRKSKERAKWN